MKAIWLSLLLLAVAPAAQAAESRPAPPALTFVFEEIATLGPTRVVGDAPEGRRQIVPVTGGTFEGPGLKGRILPGGADYQLVRADGSVTVEADYMIETDDGVAIRVRNLGVIIRAAGDRPAYMWAAPTFHAPNGRYGWLNQAIFVSSITPTEVGGQRAVRITIYRVG